MLRFLCVHGHAGSEFHGEWMRHAHLLTHTHTENSQPESRRFIRKLRAFAVYVHLHTGTPLCDLRTMNTLVRIHTRATHARISTYIRTFVFGESHGCSRAPAKMIFIQDRLYKRWYSRVALIVRRTFPANVSPSEQCWSLHIILLPPSNNTCWCCSRVVSGPFDKQQCECRRFYASASVREQL